MLIAQRDSIKLLQGAILAAIVIPALLFAYAAFATWNSLNDQANRDIERTSDVVNEHALKVFEHVKRSIAEVNEIIRGMSDADISANQFELHRRFVRIVEDSAQIKSLWVFAADGRALVSSLAFPVGTENFSDRDYFIAHVERPSGTYIGKVLWPRAPYTGAPFFSISERRKIPSDTFAGVIQVSVLPEYFEAFYQRLAREPGEYASLVRTDGFILARYPVLTREARLALDGALYKAMQRQPAGGQVTLVSAIDGVKRTVRYRKLADFPVFVLSGLDAENLRNRFLGQLASQLMLAVPAALALVAILVLTLRRTRRMFAEANARQAAETALQKSQRLEALGQLTGGVAHDFNNLLMVIGGSTERAMRKATDPEIARSLSMITSAVQRAETLTRRLLAFSRRKPLSPKVVDLDASVSGFQDVLRQSLRGDIELEIIPSGSACRIKVDLDELEIALLNIVLNARDAMPAGGKIVIATTCSNQSAEISIKDTGVGVPNQIIGKVFEPFFTTKAEKGTGLGLSQVHGFVTQAGGTVGLESAVGTGTTIKIQLPISTEDLDERTAVPANSQNKIGGKVLLVEDNAEVAVVAEDYLRRCGCIVVKADRAEVGKEILARSDDISFVISDVVMPGMSGLEFGRWIKKHKPHVPLILTTGYTDKASLALKEGFVLISKPYTFETLYSVVSRAMASTHNGR